MRLNITSSLIIGDNVEYLKLPSATDSAAVIKQPNLLQEPKRNEIKETSKASSNTLKVNKKNLKSARVPISPTTSSHSNFNVKNQIPSQTQNPNQINTSNNIDNNEIDINKLTVSSGQSLDQIYMKLKMKELNDDFERRQKMLEFDKKINTIEAENAELNIYRKIINISISIIVTGLLMGILLGLILVMYLNSKK